MSKKQKHFPIVKTVILAAASPLMLLQLQAQTVSKPQIAANAALSTQIKGFNKINPTTVEVIFTDNQRLTFDFYGANIFRVFEDTAGGIVRDPAATPPAQILVDHPRRSVGTLEASDKNNILSIATSKIAINIDKNSSLFSIVNKQTGKTVVQTLAPVQFEKGSVSLILKENPEEYFYGGGVQNGRFSHKGRTIAIENQNSWTDNGVASPNPFYWSTEGYGVMWYTFKQGKYDFGSKEKGKVVLSHNTNYLDVFFMVSDGAVALLNDFYQLTGHPILLPKFGFYEGHLNAYNRDYWKEDSTGKGILFENGHLYKESQKDNGGTKESLNGEKNNYQFSARAVIDRYKQHDMPLGWILPNDGYGAGYGQTSTLDSNIANLKAFGDYARKNGVQIGLWTQSDLHPKEGISALLQRDIVKEIRDAGVRVLKTDVAWVGAGYSFGLNGVSEVGGHIMPYYGHDARPFIISLDGWAGTQRYAGIWTGDQTGGQWEYIRFHIPTYIGSGLSGQPNITSDMDGIFGGKNPIVNIRDFQWKTFTPMQLNMDGWGSNEKYPHALGEPAASINRNYLKWKAQLIPYTYSIAKEAVDGEPIMRAMFLDKANPYTLGKATQYQYLYGPYFLIAPIYQETKMDKEGNDIRNNIYLPEGVWYDYFTGEKYTGGKVVNSFNAPIWKLPVFVKAGAIIPMANPNNNIAEINKNLRIFEIYPSRKSSFSTYDDDGTSEAYKSGQNVTTVIDAIADNAGKVTIEIHPTTGGYEGFDKEKATELRINISTHPKSLAAKIGGKKISLKEVNSLADFKNGANVYYYDAAPELNQFATKDSAFAKVKITKNPLLLVKIASTDVTANAISLTVKGYQFDIADKLMSKTGVITAPAGAQVKDTNKTAYTLRPTWDAVPNADYYEIEYDSVLYSQIKDTAFFFESLQPVTEYTFKLRAVNTSGVSPWKTIHAKTSVNPLEFAIKGIAASATTASQGGEGLLKLVDFDEDNVWHSKYGQKAVPFDVILDLKSINTLDKLEYLPRMSGANGIFMNGKIAYSDNKQEWTDAGSFNWARTPAVKTFEFAKHPVARYIKISVDKAYGDYGSGREIFVYKVKGTESMLPGDINNDHKIDNNDLTSYMNYTGLRKGDGDFDGYVSNGDINKNGLIDAFDISNVTTQLDGGINNTYEADSVGGKLSISVAKKEYNKNETVEIIIKGYNLKNVNGLSFALPYNANDFEYEGIQNLKLTSMENLTYDRLHTNGQKALYPTFVNIGDQKVINGSEELFIIKMKAKHKLTFNLKMIDGILVDKNLDSVTF